VQSTGLDPSILAQHDPRWARLRFARVPGVDLRDHFRGALIGGAIGDAERRRGGDTRPSGFRLGFFRGVMLPFCDG